MKVLIKIYDNVKYNVTSEEVAEVEYNIAGYKIISGGKEAVEIESHIDGSSIDEFHEYLILEFEDGKIGTFCNSHVDMFRL